ncbi:unnamed protein product [Rhodiola kirilowii]
MGATESDPVIIRSSIALLQERFKQLHREKRRREERELLRLFSDSPPPASFNASQSTAHYNDYTNKRRRLFHTEFLLTDDKKPPKVPLSLWPSSSINCQTAYWDAEAPVAKKKQTQDRLALCDLSSFMGSFETDVDTSLHL